MNKITRIFLLAVILTGQMFASFADRGAGRKKSRIVLNIKSSPNATFTSTLNFNLRNGMKYSGSLNNTNTFISPSGFRNTLITYTKGNNIYVLPTKQKLLIPDARPGYAGTKLIIRVP